MGNSALCGDCCVDLCPWLLRKKRRLTVTVFGFEKCGKTSFVHKAIRMNGGTVLNANGPSSTFTVETLDMGEKTRLEIFDVCGGEDDRVLWPTYFNFGIQGLIYVIDGTASDEIIEENIHQLLLLIQHDAIVKPRNSSGANDSSSSGEFRNADGTTSKDLSSTQRQRNLAVTSKYSSEDLNAKEGNGEHTNTNKKKTSASSSSSSSGEKYFDTPVAIVINKGDKYLKQKSEEKLATGSSDRGKFASSLCAKFSLQDRILSAVRAKIASTLLTPKRQVNNDSDNNHSHHNSSSDENHHHRGEQHQQQSTSSSTKKAAAGKINFDKDQEMQDKKSIIVDDNNGRESASTSPVDADVINKNLASSSANNTKEQEQKGAVSSSKSNSTNKNNNSNELPPAEAIPFDLQVNCAGFRWQIFEVSSVNGENVVNVIDWLTNAMLRGAKP